MSSILEALRELEGERPPAVRRDIPPADAPGPARRAAGAVIPILGGIAVGMVLFGFWAWAPGLLESTRPAATTVAEAPAPEIPAPDAPPAERPNWLDNAEAPRARVTPGGTSVPAPAAPPRRATAPTSAASAPAAAAPAAPAPAAPAAPAPTAAAPATPPANTDVRDAAPPARNGGQVAVEAISYSADPGQRVATMRVHGRRVTLRQREAVDGIEVQLIMPNGVYVQRGSEVYLLPISR